MNTPPQQGDSTANLVVDAEASTGGVSTDTRSPIRWGYAALALGTLGFLIWAVSAPIDEGVAAPGTVAIETRRNTIQHFSGGIVRKVHVKEGQQVRAGDLLVTLDDGMARANMESIRQNYLGLRAAESRLMAEQTSADSIRFHPDLAASINESVVKQHLSVQEELFKARRASLQAEMRAGEEAIQVLQAQVAGSTEMLRSRQVQSRLLNEQIINFKGLADQGYAPRNQLLQLEQSQAELQASMADLDTNIKKAGRSIEETRLRIAVRRQEYLKEVSSQLSEVRREVQAGQEKLRAVREELARVDLRSPVDGQVVGMAITAVGGVLSPGQRLLDVVPKGEVLLIDAKLPAHVIDRVKVGGMAEVRFHAFAHSPDLVLPAKILTVSSDVITEPTPGGNLSYYLARIEITKEGMTRLGERVLQAGMPADVLLKTGERTLLNYLLHPLTKRIASAMTEE